MITIEHDLRGRFPSVRDQGARPTCLSCAASDLHAATRSSGSPALSAEYLFHAATRGRPNRLASAGVSLDELTDALSQHGQCLEADWPYLDGLDPMVHLPDPPNGLQLFKGDLARQANPLGLLKTYLANSIPILLIVRMCNQFFRPDSSGLIVPSAAGENAGLHAVVAVGAGSLENGEDCYLLRNSWGFAWGLGGHAWATNSYLAERIYAVSQLTPL